jgi:hypothetical protein
MPTSTKMCTITADPVLNKLLGGLKEVTEIWDQDGDFLGIFTPKEKAGQWLIEKAKELFDPKEIERRRREEAGQGCTLEEIKKRLHSSVET